MVCASASHRAIVTAEGGWKSLNQQHPNVLKLAATFFHPHQGNMDDFVRMVTECGINERNARMCAIPMRAKFLPLLE
jgi:hypothetical protein